MLASRLDGKKMLKMMKRKSVIRVEIGIDDIEQNEVDIMLTVKRGVLVILIVNMVYIIICSS